MFIRLLTCVLLFASFAVAEAYNSYSTPRFTLYVPKDSPSTTSLTPTALATKTVNFMNKTHVELERLFGAEMKDKVTLKLLSPSDFHRETGAPSWTSAMYYQGEIFAPVEMGNVDIEELQHSLKHEYVHAFVASLSKSKCPAWFDEGIAQLIEGEPNSLLGPALRKWTAKSAPIPLNWIDDGFMGLSKRLVPVAYAQSLFAVRELVETKKMESVSRYLHLMGDGYSSSKAFRLAFGVSQRDFERSLGKKINRWAASSQPHP